jgi:hypothetical protein
LKAGTRVLINTSPEPFSNWFASLSEDVIVVGGLVLSLTHPIVFLVALGIFIALAIWLIPKIWRGIKVVFNRLMRLFGAKSVDPPDNGGDQMFQPRLLRGEEPGEPRQIK